MDYGEELAYWYLRLNGFFPITNFVVHRTETTKHRADIDVLAIRPPHVYEDVGGHHDDWDAYLREHLPFDRLLGLVCEVKTGAFEKEKLFREHYLRYTLPRLGLAKDADSAKVAVELSTSASSSLGDGGYVAKLLISQEPSQGPYLNRTLAQLESFLTSRVQKYSVEKYASRMFFPSQLLQHLIDRVNRAHKGDADS
jgi:hypothetical protein